MEHPIRPENHQAEPSDTSCINYFSIGSMKSAMTKVGQASEEHDTCHHLETVEETSKRLWGLRKLGVPVWIAERESQWGDHCQFIATKSSLVSCLDYYMERHDLKFN